MNAETNQRLREQASVDIAAQAHALYSENAERIGAVTNGELAILLGRIVTTLEVLNSKIDFLEGVLTQKSSDR
jgi:hypothetical protein